MYFLGIDLGKRRDHTAIAVVERRQTIDRGFDHVAWRHTSSPRPDEWLVRRLERLPLGTPYTTVADHLVELDHHPMLQGQSTIVVDATGVGVRHLHEMLEDGILLRRIRYSISPYGMTLARVLQKICEWGRRHQARVKTKTKSMP